MRKKYEQYFPNENKWSAQSQMTETENPNVARKSPTRSKKSNTKSKRPMKNNIGRNRGF